MKSIFLGILGRINGKLQNQSILGVCFVCFYFAQIKQLLQGRLKSAAGFTKRQANSSQINIETNVGDTTEGKYKPHYYKFTKLQNKWIINY